ncbi:MAG: tyrosine protein phosphatase, partial [Tetragenococcus koreensis]|nr:tyrosine protein phosphatase [Tetragenococcus koreensis]
AKFREDPNQLLPYLEMGCLAQLTAPSLVGTFGKSIQKTAQEMVDHHLVQMVASDAHGVNKRRFHLKEAYELMENEKAELMQQVAKDVINGDEVSYPSPEKVKKKKFGLF